MIAATNNALLLPEPALQCGKISCSLRTERQVNATAMPQDSAQAMNYCLRWKQTVSGGILHWYVRRLASDLHFWGYVHIRTEALTQNRSFDGVIPKDVWQQATQLLGCIHHLGTERVTPLQMSDGALLEGDAGTGKVLIECNTVDRDTSEGAAAFFHLTELIQPYVCAAALLEAK